MSFDLWFWITSGLIIFTILVILNYLKNKKFHALMARIPGPPGYPLLGNINMVWSNSYDQSLNGKFIFS